MTDCGTEYAIASYKGIAFEIRPVEHSGGRRVVTSQYPFTDAHYNEDLGERAEKWTVKGCFTGPDFRDKLTIAKRLWRQGEDGAFLEPTENVTHRVTLTDWSFNYDHTKLNYVEFDLQFTASAELPYPIIVSALGGVNTSLRIENYLKEVRRVYRKVNATLQQIARGLNAARSFIQNVGRVDLVPRGFRAVIDAINGFAPSRDHETNVVSAENIYSSAITNEAGLGFFRRSSELRVNAVPAEADQASMVAAVGLGFYFEKLSTIATPSLQDVADFRDRAVSLKLALPDLGDALDDLIAGTAGLSVARCTTATVASGSALVASYQVFGNVSQAYDIVTLSNGVSGAALPVITHPCQV
jgi:DNA circularisation protein N-terminus